MQGIGYRILIFIAISFLFNLPYLPDAAGGPGNLPGPMNKPAPSPPVAAPGPEFSPPVGGETKAGAPIIFSHSLDAGPDESLFLTGEEFTENTFMFGPSVKRKGGADIPHEIVSHDFHHMIISPGQLEPDGLYLFWIGNDHGYSEAARINAPNAWWSAPYNPISGSTLRIFGRNLARRPDQKTAFVYLNMPGREGKWLEVIHASKYELSARLPNNLEAGEYTLWVHAGNGGDYGWSDPLRVIIRPAPAGNQEVVELGPDASEDEIQALLDQGKRVRLGMGIYHIGAGLVLPENAALEGEGPGKTVLQLAQEAGPHQYGRGASGWGSAVSRLVGGGALDYEVSFPAGGSYHVWFRYRYMDPDSRKHEQPASLFSIQSGGKTASNVPTPAYSESWQWARGVPLVFEQGWNKIRVNQRNAGEVLVDAFVFSADENWNPGNDSVEPADGRVILQVEDVIHMQSWKGRLPGRAYAGIWLAGDNSSLKDLTVSGSPQFSVGILIADDSKISWVRKVGLHNVAVFDIDGRQMNNCGVLVERAEEVVIEGCDITGRNPIYLKGMRKSRISGNRLSSVTRYGGNGEGYICSRTSILQHTIIENNVFYSPYRGAGYTGRRMIWVSTGVGSVDNNVFKGNRVERTHFGGVAGTDQNVGEMILFEWCSQTAYYGNPVTSGSRSITLPEKGPFLPKPEGAEEELPLNNYYDGDAFLEQFYITIVKGKGMGQTRRVTCRDGGETLIERPWDVLPDNNSKVIMNTLFERNLVIDNEITDGMTGVQLWIGCMENIVADNIIRRQRRQAIFVYACMMTAAEQVPRMWNAGIGPSFYNFIEGNETDECASGVLFGASQGLFSHGLMTGIPYEPVPGPMDFPLLLGNVVRQNSAVRSRSAGIQISASRSDAVAGEAVPLAVGNIVEFNLLRDAFESGIRIGDLTDMSAVRRNHIYSWFKENDADLPVGIDVRGAKNIYIGDNNIENKHGGEIETPNSMVRDPE